MNVLPGMAGVAGMKAAPAFLPTEIANLQLWLDAADTATITDAGSGAVSAWNDKSGLGRHFEQGTSGSRPITGVTTQNGRNVINFDASRHLDSTAAASTWTFLHNADGSSIFLVLRSNDHSNNQSVFGTSAASQSHGALIALRNDMTNRARININRNVAATDTLLNETGTGFYSNLEWMSLSFVNDPGNGTAADRSELRKNGGTAVKNNTLTNAPSTADPSATLRVGGVGNTTNNRFNGSIAEVIVYSGVIGADDRAKVESYLSAKWGIALA